MEARKTIDPIPGITGRHLYGIEIKATTSKEERMLKRIFSESHVGIRDQTEDGVELLTIFLIRHATKDAAERLQQAVKAKLQESTD